MVEVCVLVVEELVVSLGSWFWWFRSSRTVSVASS